MKGPNSDLRDFAAVERSLRMLYANKSNRAHANAVEITAAYCSALGFDLDCLPPVIHIAGTKGKGSTAAFVESVLRAHGLRTALFTSPHLLNVRERIRINGKPVEESLFVSHFWKLWDRLTETEASPEKPQAHFFCFMLLLFFHLLLPGQREDANSLDVDESASCVTKTPSDQSTTPNASLMREVASHGVEADVVILEVGLGGRLDNTNIIRHPAVVAITRLDLDHMNILGDTIEDIAYEKAGICKRGVPVFTVQQSAGGMKVLREVVEKIAVKKFKVVPPLESMFPPEQSPILGIKGDFQKENASLALHICSEFLQGQPQIMKRIAREIGSQDIASFEPGKPTHDVDTYRHRDFLMCGATLRGLENCFWPGRAHKVYRQISMGKSWPRATAQNDNELKGSEEKGAARPAEEKGAARPTDCPLTLYLDGAHTPLSMKACLSWYKRDIAGESSERKMAPARFLLFACAEDREPIPLLNEIAKENFDFIGFYQLAKFKKGANPPAADKLLNQISVGYSELLPGCLRSSSPAKDSVSDCGAWNCTLARLWIALKARCASSRAKDRSSALKEEVDSQTEKVSLLNSAEDVLFWLEDRSQSMHNSDNPLAMHPGATLLVCGSFYLISDVLALFDWTEDEHTKE